MSPRTVFCLTTVGVLLAGAPLLHLTGRSAPADAAGLAGVPAADGANGADGGANAGVVYENVWVTLRYTGRPESIQVACGGKGVVSAAGGPEGVWEGEAPLPASGRVELEVTVTWPEGQADAAQAVSVSLCPAGREERTETQWTFPGESALHSVFTFSDRQQP